MWIFPAESQRITWSTPIFRHETNGPAQAGFLYLSQSTSGRQSWHRWPGPGDEDIWMKRNKNPLGFTVIKTFMVFKTFQTLLVDDYMDIMGLYSIPSGCVKIAIGNSHRWIPINNRDFLNSYVAVYQRVRPPTCDFNVFKNGAWTTNQSGCWFQQLLIWIHMILWIVMLYYVIFFLRWQNRHESFIELTNM